MLLLCAVVLTTACSKSDPDPGNTVLKVDRVSLKFGTNQSVVVNIEYAGEWTAELEDDSWCELEKTFGAGNTALKVSLKERSDASRLSTTLTIRSKANPSIYETVKLSIDGVDFIIDPVAVEFGLGQLYYDIEVNYEGNWTATLDNQTWCTIDKTSGKGKTTIRLTNKDNMDQASGKTAKLVVSPVEYPTLRASVDIKQVNKFTHGSYLTLNKATVGKGIDLVIVGDGFTEAHMAKEGKWQDVAKKAMNVIFDYEPYKSFKNHFNVYMVNAVSNTDVIGTNSFESNTFFRTFIPAGKGVSMADGSKAQDFAYEHSPIRADKGTDKAMFLIILMNSEVRDGIGSPGEIGGHSLNTLADLGLNFEYLVVHEFTHTFGKLVDEYVHFQSGMVPSNLVEINKQFKLQGRNNNVEYTNDRNQFINQAWRKLLDMEYPSVGVYEGGAHYERGVWRSSEYDLMGNSKGTGITGLGPVNRELLLKQIYKLSGREAEYSFQTFLDYDKVNLK